MSTLITLIIKVINILIKVYQNRINQRKKKKKRIERES